MRKLFFNVFLWVYIKAHSLFLNLGMAMRDEALFNTNIGENKKSHQRWFRSVLLQKFEAGQRDEKYVQDYYELLKKADKFQYQATPHKKAVAADRWGMNMGQKDQFGRRYDHVGFFDDQHKHAGKTIREVIEAELEERRTKDDDYELLGIINNTPIETGLSKIDDVVDTEYRVNDLQNMSKKFEFPIKINRSKDVLNKIEQLAEYMHIKKIGFEHRQLEFFIPLKFKTQDIDENDPIFKQLTDIEYVYTTDRYGEMGGFRIMKFEKRITHNDEYEVWKFHAIEMETIKQY